MKKYRLQLRNATEVRYVDPNAFFDTATFKTVVQPKKAGSLTVYNAASAINMQRTVTLPLPAGSEPCATTNQEKLALRFSLSGSTQSHAAVKTLLLDFRALLDAHIADLAAGFLPTVDFIEIT